MSLEFEKEQAVQALCAHYARDHLSTGELESRFERVYQSTDLNALRTVFDGLPAMTGLAVPAPLYSVAGPGSALPPNEKRYVAVFSELKKEGHWVPAPNLRVRVVMGAIVLDFRDALLPSGGIDIDLDVILGEAKILLPPGVSADVDCSSILGSVEDKARGAIAGGPRIRVRGGAVLGTIVVITKLPKAARMESWRKQLRSFFGASDDDEPRRLT